MTFEELKAAIGTWLARDEEALPTSVRGQIVNICQRELLRVNSLRFGQKTALVQTVPGQAWSTLPTNWSRPHSFVKPGSEQPFVTFISKEEYDVRYSDPAAAAGDPIHVTEWSGQLWWGPTPASALNITCNYFCYLTDLRDQGTPPIVEGGPPVNYNNLTIYGWEALLFRSLWYASAFLVEDARIDTWAKLAQKFEMQLIVEHSHSFRSVTHHPESKELGT